MATTPANTDILLVVGEPPYAEGAGDRHTVELSEADARLITSAANGERRVIVVLLCGRPLALPPAVLEAIDALLVGWWPGTEGAGVTDGLFGHSAVRGKLSFSWPRGPMHPRLEDRTPDAAALFPCGFGLDLPAARPEEMTADELW